MVAKVKSNLGALVPENQVYLAESQTQMHQKMQEIHDLLTDVGALYVPIVGGYDLEGDGSQLPPFASTVTTLVHSPALRFDISVGGQSLHLYIAVSRGAFYNTNMATTSAIDQNNQRYKMSCWVTQTPKDTTFLTEYIYTTFSQAAATSNNHLELVLRRSLLASTDFVYYDTDELFILDICSGGYLKDSITDISGISLIIIKDSATGSLTFIRELSSANTTYNLCTSGSLVLNPLGSSSNLLSTLCFPHKLQIINGVTAVSKVPISTDDTNNVYEKMFLVGNSVSPRTVASMNINGTEKDYYVVAFPMAIVAGDSTLRLLIELSDDVQVM